MKNRLYSIVFACAAAASVCLISIPAAGLIPPISEEELEKGADVIIEGRVAFLGKEGKVRFDDCYGWQAYQADISVESVHKGDVNPGKLVVVRYSKLIVDKGVCDGGGHSYSLEKAGRYRLYLHKAGTAEKPHYIFYHRQCVKKLPKNRNKKPPDSPKKKPGKPEKR